MRYEERKSERRDKIYPAEGRGADHPARGHSFHGTFRVFFRSGRERFFPQSHSRSYNVPRDPFYDPCRRMSSSSSSWRRLLLSLSPGRCVARVM